MVNGNRFDRPDTLRSLLLQLVAAILFAAGCSGEGSAAGSGTAVGGAREVPTSTAAPPSTAVPPAPPTTLSQPAQSEPTVTEAGEPPDPVYGIGYPEHRVDGNRYVEGKGGMPIIVPLDIPLDGEPVWLVAVPAAGGSVWAAVLANGATQAFNVGDGTAEPIPISPARFAAETPPVLTWDGFQATLVANPGATGSTLTRPTLLTARPPATVSIGSDGDLHFWNGGERAALALNALPDGRPLFDGSDRLLILTGPTDRYAHGVLGDQLEASGIAVVSLTPSPALSHLITIPEPVVIEGISPILADLSGDGEADIIVTESDAGQGARIVVYDTTGERIAQGASIGRGFRWRHQIAVAPFGPDGEMELAAVRTPHIGGVVEFYRLVDAALEIVAEEPGYRSHLLGSRNLDMGLAGDFDGDGRVELLVPDQSIMMLGGVGRTEGGAETKWQLPMGGRLTSNLAAVTLSDGSIVAGAGHDGQLLRLWMP